MTDSTPMQGNGPGLPGAGDTDLKLRDIHPDARWKASKVGKLSDLISLAGDCIAEQRRARLASFSTDPQRAADEAAEALAPAFEIQLREPDQALHHVHALLRSLLVFAESVEPASEDFAAGVWLLDSIGAPALRAMTTSRGEAIARMAALAEAAKP